MKTYLSMSRQWSLCNLLATLSVILSWHSLLTSAATAQPPDAKRPVTVHDILDWLPSDTETLLVANGPFNLERTEGKLRDGSPLDKCLEIISYAMLENIQGGTYVKMLSGQKVTLVVEGSRRFRPAKGLGLWPYEGCNILVFGQDLGATREMLKKAMAANATKTQQILGNDVYSFQEKVEDDLWRFFISLPKPNIIICATDQAYMEELLRRMQKRAATRAFPADLTEWKHLDTSVRFWAVRHFGMGNRLAENRTLLDPKAIGLTFSYDPGSKDIKKKLPKVVYLSSSENAREIATRAWTHFEKSTWRLNVVQNAPGVVEVGIADLTDDEAQTFLLLLLFRLGHLVNL